MVLRLVFDVLHYMFRPTWPSSGVYDISLFIPEGISFAAFVAHSCTCSYFARSHLCFSVVFVSFLILVCVFAFLPFLVVCRVYYHYFTTDGQPVSMSWCREPLMAHDQI
jgi:hypothetical protein